MENEAPKKGRLPVGVGVALMASVLFGVSTPFAKLLLGNTPPVLLAGLLYLGSGIGLSALYLTRRTAEEAPLTRPDLSWLVGAVLFGGIVTPVLLMLGLQHTPASTASLLLNLEGVFTSLLAWFVFKENFDRRIFLGIALIVAGGVVLSWQGEGLSVPLWSLAIAGACLCWGIDNNLTQKVSASNPYQVAAIKGAVAGTVNLVISLSLGARLPALPSVGGALLVGFLGYGLSMAFFVLALRHVGTARNSEDGFVRVSVRTLAAEIAARWPEDATDGKDVSRQMEWITRKLPGRARRVAVAQTAASDKGKCLFCVLELLPTSRRAFDAKGYVLGSDFIAMLPVEK